MWRNMKVLLPRIWFGSKEELKEAVDWLGASDALISLRNLVQEQDGQYCIVFCDTEQRDRCWDALAHWRSLHHDGSVQCRNCGQPRDDCDCPNGFDREEAGFGEGTDE